MGLCIHIAKTARSYSSERNSVSFPERYSKSEKDWDFDILCTRSPGVRGICANAPLCTALICSVARASGFFVQVGFCTELIVKEKGLINLSCLHMYQLLQSTRFEMYLLVMYLLGRGDAPLYRLNRYVQRQRDMFFSAVLVINRVSILAILVINRIGVRGFAL